ncbi:tyrosyl-DNA phosphodiesterase-domain-containing protein [Aspergillus crustosus]
MDSADSDDEALRAAIAASLKDRQSSAQHGASYKKNGVVDLTGDTDDEGDDDVIPIYPKSLSVISSETSRAASVTEVQEDDDEDLRRAIALSMQDSGAHDLNSAQAEPASISVSLPEQFQMNDQAEPRSTPGGLGGLDRKKMEEERLARLSKRKAEDTPSVEQREVKQSRTEPQQIASNVRATPASVPSSTPSIQFPAGTVKKTFAFGYRRSEEDIKIEEVLQKSDLELAVLSSFMWDMDWLFEKVNLRSSRCILVMQAKDDATKRQYESETADMTTLRLCFPPMEGQVNCMHSKLMLLFHPGYLRVAVPTANLVPYDWGEAGGVMENSVFLIDLPKKDPSSTTNEPKTNFYTDLVHFLKATTLHENVIAKLENFDFSKTSRFAFVHTIGGSHLGDAWKLTGYCGLGRAISSLGLHINNPINLDFVTSSLGSLTPEYLKSIYLAAQGDSGLTELTLRTTPSKSLPTRSPENPQQLISASTAEEWKDNRFRAYFPSQDTVLGSKGGPNSAGTICFQKKWFENGKFPRGLLRDCASVREGLVMHNKILYVQPDDPISLSDNSECLGWAYVGSANLSESAWGRLVFDRSTKEPKLNCRNWECGVVVPVLRQSDPGLGTQDNGDDTSRNNDNSGKGKGMDSVKEENETLLEIFKGTVPVPMKVPGRRYEGTGGPSRKPWYFMEMD